MYKTNKGNIYGIVLAGGRGSRLPIAGSTPKQFATKFADTTFVQDIVRMMRKAIKPGRIFCVVSNEEQEELAIMQLTPLGVPSSNIIMFDPCYGYVAVMAMACDYVAGIDPDATVFVSPSDQHIISEDKFVKDIKLCTSLTNQGESVLLGVKVFDANIVGGCGNAIYDSTQEGPSYDIEEFIEKPAKKPGYGSEFVKRLLMDDNSVVNTGFYAFKAQKLCGQYPARELEAKLRKFYLDNSEATDLGLNPEHMMQVLGMRLVVGGFNWADCGTLSAYYDIQRKTPNHKNASIGEVSRHDCKESLFISSTEGIHIYATNIKKLAIIANATKSGGINVAAISLAESQEVGKVTDFFERSNRASYSYNSENCVLVPSNISQNVRVAFLGVQNIFVFVNRLDNGDINVNVSANGNCIYDKD